MSEESEHFEEPPRLLEQQQSSMTRAVLEAGLWQDDSERRRLQVLAAIGVGTAVSATSKTTLASFLASSKNLLAGAVVAGTGIGGAAMMYSAVTEPAAPMPVVIETAAVAEAKAPEAPKVDEPQAEETGPAKLALTQPPPPKAARVARRGVSKRRVVKEQAKANIGAAESKTTPASIQDEIAALDRARSAIRGGRPSAALTELGHYAQQFPKGTMRLEAEVLRIQALAASGNRAEASRRAERILKRSPNSIVASRLKRFVEQ